jgi:hypothetical protein
VDRTSMLFAPAIFALVLSASALAQEQHGLALEDVTHPEAIRGAKAITPPAKDYEQHAKDWK